MKEAMKLALEHIEGNYTVSAEDAIKALEEALINQENLIPSNSTELEKQEQGEQGTLAYREAASLANWLFKKHYAHEEHYASGRVVWGLCDTTAGVISQIDNMVCKLVCEQEQGEPVAMRYDFDGYGYKYIDNGSDWQTRIKDAEPVYGSPQQRKPLDVVEIMRMWSSAKNSVVDFTRAIEAHGIKENT